MTLTFRAMGVMGGLRCSSTQHLRNTSGHVGPRNSSFRGVQTMTWPKKMKHPYDPWLKLIALTWLGVLIFDLCHWLKVIALTYHLLKMFMTFFWGASG